MLSAQRAMIMEMNVKPVVLFLCTGNACRSQMAEGFARRILADRIVSCSAGVDPHGMNPRAMSVMAEAGFPIDDQHSKHVDTLVDAGVTFDVVLTVCGNADEKCPALPGPARRIHRGFDDPPRLAAGLGDEQAILDCYRKVRDQIRDYVQNQLLHDLALAPRGAGR
jgi:arsenate reductase (thioredoxin)